MNERVDTAAHHGLIVESQETLESKLGENVGMAIYVCASCGFQRCDRLSIPRFEMASNLRYTPPPTIKSCAKSAFS